MEKILRDFFETASSDELAVFEHELSDIAAGSECEDTETVLRKSVHRAGISRRRLTFRKRMAIMIAAAFIMIPTSVAVANHLNNLEMFFGIEDGNSPFVSEFVKSQSYVENDDARLVVDGAFSDDICTYMMVSFYAKNEKGRQYIYDAEHCLSESETGSVERYNEAIAKYGNAIYDSPVYYQTCYNLVFTQLYKGYMADSVRMVRDDSGGALYYKITVRNDHIDTDRPFKLIEAFSGLSLDLSVEKNIEMIRLVSDDKEAFHDVMLSPLAIYIRFDDRDVRYPYSLHALQYTAVLKGGETVNAVTSNGGSSGYPGDYDFSKHEDWVANGRGSFGNIEFKAPINIYDFESIEIDGKVYRPEK